MVLEICNVGKEGFKFLYFNESLNLITHLDKHRISPLSMLHTLCFGLQSRGKQTVGEKKSKLERLNTMKNILYLSKRSHSSV